MHGVCAIGCLNLLRYDNGDRITQAEARATARVVLGNGDGWFGRIGTGRMSCMFCSGGFRDADASTIYLGH